MKTKRNFLSTMFGLILIATILFAPSLDRLSAVAQDESDSSSDEAFITTALTQQQKLIAPDGEAIDLLGSSVAIEGNTAVVGAHKDKTGVGTNLGAAYVYVRSGNTWLPQQKLTAPPDEDGDRFGFSVSISGNTIVVGAPADDIGAIQSQGSAYVFTRSNSVWTMQQKLTVPDGETFDSLGASVAITGDTIALGAVRGNAAGGQDQGSVYIFTRADGTWTQQQQIAASDGVVGHRFGQSVALSNDTLLVGASAAVIEGRVNQGAAYVFTRSGDVWNESQKLTASDGEAQDVFGASASISGDALVIGAFQDKTGNPTATFGSAYVFIRSNGIWSEQQKLTGDDDAVEKELFGISVSISGNRIVAGSSGSKIGANNSQGAAYIFSQSNGVWAREQKLVADDGASGDAFGTSVAIHADTIIVGAREADIDAKQSQGAAYIFADPSQAALPEIESVSIKGKRLIITGSNFESPTEILVNGQKQKKTSNDMENPTIVVIAKKAGKPKFIAPGQTVKVQVRNVNTGEISNEFMFTRPL